MKGGVYERQPTDPESNNQEGIVFCLDAPLLQVASPTFWLCLKAYDIFLFQKPATGNIVPSDSALGGCSSAI